AVFADHHPFEGFIIPLRAASFVLFFPCHWSTLLRKPISGRVTWLLNLTSTKQCGVFPVAPTVHNYFTRT
ncbi:MAG: hypothetical protein K1X58_15910, partial [Flavobacteriales bacterium]|nr:hypothetical protein [Flavobacteriales bacterium]